MKNHDAPRDDITESMRAQEEKEEEEEEETTTTTTEKVRRASERGSAVVEIT